ncbi:unnamed protein product [Closterium sp. NIES-53]
MRFYIAPEEGEMAEAEHRGQLEQGKEELEWGRGSAENGVLSGVDVDKPKGAQKQGGTGTKNGSESTRTHPTHNDGPNDKPSAKPSPSPSPAPSAAPITSPVSPQSDVSSSSESPSDSETPRPSRTSISLFSRLSSESGGSLHDSRRSAYEALPSPARHDAPSETPGIGEPQQLTTACVGMPTAALTPEWAAEREGKSAVGQPTESSNSGSSCWTASEYEPSCSESTDAGVPIAQPCTIAEAKLFDSKLMNGDYATTRSTGRGAGGSTTTSSSSCSDNVPMAYPLDSDYSSEGTSPLDDLRQITRSFSERCGSGGARSSRWRAAARLSVDFGSSPAASPQLPRKALPPKLLAVVPRSGAEPSFAGTAERSGSVITRTRPLARVSPREGLGSAAQANRRIQRRFSFPGRPQTAARKAPLMDGEDRVCATQIVDDRRSQALHERVRINRIARRDFGPIRHVSSSPVLLARNASERASPREAAEGGGDRGGGGEALPGVGKGGREWRAGDAARILNAVAGASAGMMAVGVDGKRTGRPIQFETWLDNLQLYLLSDSRDSVSLFDHTTGAAPTPPATADSATRSHTGQHRHCTTLSSLATPCLPLLFLELSTFATVEDLVSHLLTSDARYRAAAPAEDHFLSLDPTVLTIDLLEQHLLAAETSVVTVGDARGTPRTPFFEGCSSSPLAPSYASAAAVDVPGAEDVGAASASAKRCGSKGKGGRGSDGGSRGGGGGSSGGGGGSGGGGSGGSGGRSGGFGGGGGGSGGSGGSGSGGSGGSRTELSVEILEEARGGSSSVGARTLHPNRFVTPPCSCRLLTHQTLLWHHRLGHPSLPLLRGMHSRFLVSGLPRSLPPLPPSPAPPCLPCVEGRQRAAPHSSSFPLTTAPLQTLHMDVWGPARVSGQGRERYFLLVVDDYTRYTTVFPLRSKGQVFDVLIPWIHGVRLQLRERFRQDLPVLRLHSDRGGEFSSDLLHDFCRGEGILQSFTLPDSPKQNGIAERRIGLVMEVAHTSMIHAAAPHFLWLFAVRYAVHQLNLWPHVSLPETSPTLLWTGKVGDASVFCVWGSRAFVRDTSADKLFARAIPCVFLGFSPDAPSWQFYHPTSRRVFPSQDVTFDESVPFYRLFPYRSAPPPPPPLFLALGPPPIDPLPPPGSCSLRAVSGSIPGVCTCRPLPLCTVLGLPVWGGVGSGGGEPGDAEPGVAAPEGVEPGGAEPKGVEPRGAEFEGAESGGAELRGTASSEGPAGASAQLSPRPDPLSPPQLREWFAQRTRLRSGAASTGDSTAGDTRARGAGSATPPSVGGECALGTDVLEDGQEDFECLATAVPRFASMLLAPEGDPDAPDIPPSCSYAEAITGTYVDEVPPSRANIVDGMWIIRVKRPPGSPPVFKARYVAKGFSQRQGVDYFQTFSPTPKMTTLRVLLHVAAQRDYALHSLDFSTAFLQGSLHEEIWLRRPPSFTGSFPAGTKWSLPRPVYGLSQAPREWHDTLRTTLAAPGFTPSTVDPSLFLRSETSLPQFYVLVYVDDLVFATADTEALTLVNSELQKRHTCTDLGEQRSYLGLQITRDRARRTITLTQSHMVHQVLQHFGFHNPLLCLPVTRSQLHLRTSPTSGMGLVLGGRGPVVLTGHADASWVDDSATQRSSHGYTFSLDSCSVSWRSTRSSSVLSSSCEAEIYAGAMAAQELRWLTYLLTDLGEQPRSPPVLYVDNKAIISLCQEHRLEHRTKHIALQYFLARELQQRGQLRLAYAATRANTADIFTKALPPGDHQRFSTVLGLLALLLLTGLVTISREEEVGGDGCDHVADAKWPAISGAGFWGDGQAEVLSID